MSDKPRGDTGWWLDLCLKLVVITLPAMMIWLRSQFVTHEEMEKEREQRRALNESVIRFNEARNHDTAQDSRIADFESRIRNLEAMALSGGSMRGPK